MAHSIPSLITDNARIGLNYIDRLCKDIPENLFGRFATNQNGPIESNHPAFIVGHLSLYPAKTVALIGEDASSIVPTPEYEKLFSRDAKCIDDLKGDLYPRKEELLENFRRAYSVALEKLAKADPDLLLGENPINSPMKKVCPSLGSMLGFYMSGHVTMHVGQLSAWRRMQRLGPA